MWIDSGQTLYVQSPTGRRTRDSYAVKADNEQTPSCRHKKQTDIGIALPFKPCGDDIAMIVPGRSVQLHDWRPLDRLDYCKAVIPPAAATLMHSSMMEHPVVCVQSHPSIIEFATFFIIATFPLVGTRSWPVSRLKPLR